MLILLGALFFFAVVVTGLCISFLGFAEITLTFFAASQEFLWPIITLVIGLLIFAGGMYALIETFNRTPSTPKLILFRLTATLVGAILAWSGFGLMGVLTMLGLDPYDQFRYVPPVIGLMQILMALMGIWFLLLGLATPRKMILEKCVGV